MEGEILKNIEVLPLFLTDLFQLNESTILFDICLQNLTGTNIEIM